MATETNIEQWAEDTYREFEQLHGDEGEHLDNMARMFVQLADSMGLKFDDVLHRATAYKQLFDGADLLVREGFDRDQIPLLLQRGR